MFEELSLWALFISSFISSTILPGGSEVLLGILLSQQLYEPYQLLIVASLGNTLGGITSWVLGWWIAKYYPAKRLVKAEHQRALQRVQKWGVFSLLLSWLPIIGDPLCVAAGWLRINFVWSVIMIALGKTFRYTLIVFALS